MDTKRKTVGILTSGGDSPGMNAAIRAVVRRGIVKGYHIKGIFRGYMGLMNEEIEDLDERSVADILQAGGTMLGTERYPEMEQEDTQKQAVRICKDHGIDVLVIIGGDGSFMGACRLAEKGLDVIGIPATIDGDIACTDYTIGFDTAVNTAMSATDNIRDTASAHGKCSMIEVMGRNAGDIALWCSIAGGAEQVLVPEKDHNNAAEVLRKIAGHREKGKNNNIIVCAEGVGDTVELAKEVEQMGGITVRTTLLSYIQRGGSPTCRDRVYASIMGAKAVDVISQGRSNRVVVYKDGVFKDIDIEEALSMKRNLGEVESYMHEILESLSL